MEITTPHSDYLTRLHDDVARLRAVAGSPKPDVNRFARAALSLEGVDPDAVPTVDAAAATLAATPSDAGYALQDGSWQETLRLNPEDPATIGVLRAHEVIGIARAAALTYEPPFDRFIAAVHAALTSGLVAPERLGALRTRDVAVHDSGSGRVLYQPAKPARLADALSQVTAFVDGPANRTVVSAAYALYAVFALQPFDAANGRVALIAARALLVDGLGVAPDVESRLAADRGGFHDEIAQTIRRQDATFFAERYVEALTEALRDTARTAGRLATDMSVPKALLATLRAEPTVTVKDLPDDVTPLLDAGLITPIAGFHGLKFASQLA